MVEATEIQEAVLHIFADTTYKLYVNGVFIGFGPVRFDPRYPQFDTYDLAPYLVDGVNAIAVLVNFHGHKVFKSVPAKAALIAWGQITDAKGVSIWRQKTRVGKGSVAKRMTGTRQNLVKL